MDVVYAPGDNYAVYTGVSVYSLCENNRSAGEINIYIISNDLSAENTERLKATAESFGRNIFFMDVSRELKEFSKEIDAGSYGINVFGRFFMGKLLPEKIDRLLYIDCDTVVNGSIERLFETDMEGKTAMAVPEPTIYKSVLRSIGFDEDELYFNAGVILIDFKKWVSEKISDKLIEFYKENGRRLFCADQDAINAVLRNDIGVLPPKYNFFTNYRYFSYKYLKEESASYRAVKKNEFEEAKKSPAIIHFLGTERPWIRGNLNPYRKIYKNTLGQTLFKGEGEISGRELQVFAFHIMELLTLLFPWSRRAVSGAFERKYVVKRTEASGNIENVKKIKTAETVKTKDGTM